MKEATGELNTTLIVVTAVGALAAFFFGVLWPNLKNNYDSNTKCDAAVCGYKDCENVEPTEVGPNGDGSIRCCYNKTTITCPYKG